jgi:membrane dipeptidase
MSARIGVLCSLVLVVSATAVFALPQQAPGDPLVAKALAIHERVITLDTHVDLGGKDYATPALDPGAASTPLKCDLTKMEKGKLDGVFLAVFVSQGPLDDAGYAKAWVTATEGFDAIQRLLKMYPNRAEAVTSSADVARVAKSGKRAIMIGVENGYPLGTDLANVKKFYDLGARYITLTHSRHNQVGDSSSAPDPINNGLSPFGRQVVAEMNRLGMMIDLSHSAEKTFWDVIALSKAPIIASHSGSRVVKDHDRNLTDDQLRALAKNGGVVQTVALGSYLADETPERHAAVEKLRAEVGLPAGGGAFGGFPDRAKMTPEQRAESDKKRRALYERMQALEGQYPSATLKDFVDHIDHMVKVAGIDHVGIGTDFDGGGGIAGFSNHAEAPNVTIELVRRGYTEEQIGKIWGGNLLRVWGDVERVALQIQKGQ